MTNTPVDWSKGLNGLEVYRTDMPGWKATPTFIAEPAQDGDRTVWFDNLQGERGYQYFDQQSGIGGGPYRIRNVQPAQPEVTPELAERMKELVLDMASDPLGSGAFYRSRICDLAAALNPEPVDPDLLLAQELTKERGWNADTTDMPQVRFAYHVIKRVRSEQSGLTITGEEG